MKRTILFCILALVLLSGCGKEAPRAEGGSPVQVITPEEAKALMETTKEYCLLDVREAEEYAQGHIPGAVLYPYTQIAAGDPRLPEAEDQLILVYCRSGRRSAIAAQTLAELGYTNIRDFGGIQDWPYDTTTE